MTLQGDTKADVRPLFAGTETGKVVKSATAGSVSVTYQDGIRADAAGMAWPWLKPMLAGLIHDLGAFYMLYRATQYEELRERPDTVRYLIVQWHESIGISLLNALGLPEEIVNATEDHDRLRPAPETLRTLSDVIYVANMLSGGHFEWLMQDLGSTPDELDELSRRYGYLQPEIDSLYEEIKHSLS